jgi:hypothetical protein
MYHKNMTNTLYCIKAALNANCRFVERSNVTFFLLFRHFASFTIFPQHTFLPLWWYNFKRVKHLPGRNLHVLTYFLQLTLGISCDVTINKSIVRLNKPMSLVCFRGLSRKLIVVCAHFRCQFD